jgi:predicted nucleic acid-binding protein
MEEIVYDTNQLIDFAKKAKFDLSGFTTIFNVIEFPKATEFEELTVIYPTLEDYEESVGISLTLFRKGSPLPAADILIATMCIRRNFTLCTKDNHFANIKTVRNAFKLELTK